MFLANDDCVRYHKHNKHVQTEFEKNIFDCTWIKVQGDKAADGLRK